MQLYLIRHGETDWQLMSERGVRGLAASLAPLTMMGRLQIEAITADYRLQEADAILCSSFTRALESAALLSRKLNKPLYVEYDLHEWLPQKDPTAIVDQDLLL
ncbi:MAG: histidine phosphatase family protein, partial [Trueperaceae bacterium]